ncbi:MAG: response regulator [Pseudomonadota bacterium]
MEHMEMKDKKVLIVDDEADILETLEGLLQGNDIFKASSYDEAKQLLESQDFDIAILDIMGVNGFALLDIANEKKIIAIMLTAHALSLESTIKAYKRGAAFFVPKEEMINITSFIDDVLKAKEKGENYWSSWLERLGDYYEKRFGKGWKDSDREFWEALARRDWRLAFGLRQQEGE